MYISRISIYLTSIIVLLGLSFSQTAFASECNPGQLRGALFGQNGAHVKVIQECLISAGYSLPAGATGYYGNQTKSAITKFYATVLGLKDWDGKSIGPKGRSELGARGQGKTTPVIATGVTNTKNYIRVTSADELKKILALNPNSGFGFGLGIRGSVSTLAFENQMMMAPTIGAISEVAKTSADGSNQSTPSRVSGTNVQVVGIDEPDIVKTDGKSIFIARDGYYYGVPSPMMIRPAECATGVDCGIVPPQKNVAGITAVNAFPLASLGIQSNSIIEQGELLLVKEKKLLLILGYDRITAYDISAPEKPIKKWVNEFKNNTQKIDARLKDGKLYLITSTSIDRGNPCPIIPMVRSGVQINIPCGSIWMPSTPESASVTYTVMKINPENGTEENTLTLLGEPSRMTLSMSENNLYIAQRLESAQHSVMQDFMTQELIPLLSSAGGARMKEIAGYNISYSSKLSEWSNVLEKEYSGMTKDARLKFETEVENKMKSYMERRLRDTDKTQITKIPLSTLSIAGSATVSGHLLNQFSMDEHNGYLRVAVTIGDRWSSVGTVNDVYVLDGNLATVGQVQNLGITERIYAVRFIGDRGYIVTFRETDPFYVLDLSVPSAPIMKGELKIPGYSAYLEPLSPTKILGVGREGSDVKISLFDVSNPSLPVEKSKYTLKEYWTEVENNHHAFLKDEKHKVFFIPGGNGGYILSYEGDALSLKYTVAGYNVKRALYIEDYLYIISNDKISVIDETIWKEAKTLDLNK